MSLMIGVNWALPALCALGLLIGGNAAAQADTEQATADQTGGSPRVVPLPGVTPRVIVRVGDDEIMVPDLLQFAVSNNQLAMMSDQKGRTDLLYVLIVSVLLRDAAMEEGLLSKTASPDQVRQASLELQRKHFPPPPPAPVEEARAYFEANKDRYAIPEHVRVRQILISSSPDAPQADRDAAEARVRKVVERLRSGEDFAEVAADSTDNAEAKSAGGDLGFVPLVAGTEFAKLIEPLANGQTTGVLKSERGYEIFQLIGRRPPIYPSFDDVRPAVQKAIAEEEFRRRRAEYITKLAKKAEIVFEMPEFQDAHPLKRKESDLTIFGM